MLKYIQYANCQSSVLLILIFVVVYILETNILVLSA